MIYTDLLDIYDILVHIRFSLDSSESMQLIIILEDALYMKIGGIISDDYRYEKKIREQIKESESTAAIKFGDFDDRYSNSNIALNNINIVLDFFIITDYIKKELINHRYDEAFRVVDDIHQYPLDILNMKKKSIRRLNKYVSKLQKKFLNNSWNKW